LLQRYAAFKDKHPVFAIHAKSMVIDAGTVYVGTYNLDPRSENLNTEVGIIVNDTTLADYVRERIIVDMQPGNSWQAADDPDQYASFMKRVKVRFWQFMPIKPLL
jgi:putative cardiolipin synthase